MRLTKMRAMNRIRGSWIALALTSALLSNPVLAWGPDQHPTVSAIPDKRLAGSDIAREVAAVLDGLTLQDAAVWADCAKGVDQTQGYKYTSAGQHPECVTFVTPALEAEMSDFLRRNDTNCAREPAEESCHKQCHCSDVAIQRDRHALGTTGTRNDDIVAAVGAAAVANMVDALVLQGQDAFGFWRFNTR
jgi:hypothetical protein